MAIKLEIKHLFLFYFIYEWESSFMNEKGQNEWIEKYDTFKLLEILEIEKNEFSNFQFEGKLCLTSSISLFLN